MANKNPTNLPWMRPRHQNPIIKYIEEEYLPISPQTRKPEIVKDGKAMPFRLQTHQMRILNHVFTKQFYPNEIDPITEEVGRTRYPYRTVIYSCPKKSGKTAIGGAVAEAWARLEGGEILSVANDEKQATDRAFTRVKMHMDYLRREDEDAYKALVDGNTAKEITFKEPYSNFRAIPCDPGGEAGGFQSLTVWDELWAYDSSTVNALWSELQPIPNIPESIRFVVTYAGFYGQSELLYALYEQTVDPDPQTDEPRGIRIKGLEDLPCFVNENGDTFAYWDHEARMPWHTEDFLEQARNDPTNKLRPDEYKRLWENRWSTGNEAFLPIKKVEALMEQGERMGLFNRMEAYR